MNINVLPFYLIFFNFDNMFKQSKCNLMYKFKCQKNVSHWRISFIHIIWNLIHFVIVLVKIISWHNISQILIVLIVITHYLNYLITSFSLNMLHDVVRHMFIGRILFDLKVIPSLDWKGFKLEIIVSCHRIYRSNKSINRGYGNKYKWSFITSWSKCVLS